MEKTTSDIIIVRHKENNNLYRHIEGSTFQNIINEKQKELSKDECKDFIISLRLTEMVNENPNLLTLIKLLKLQYDPTTRKQDPQSNEPLPAVTNENMYIKSIAGSEAGGNKNE